MFYQKTTTFSFPQCAGGWGSLGGGGGGGGGGDVQHHALGKETNLPMLPTTGMKWLSLGFPSFARVFSMDSAVLNTGTTFMPEN